MDWENCSCPKPHLISSDGIKCCIRCAGSISVPAAAPLFPPIRNPSDIRLLRIFRGVFEDDIRCELSVHHLSSRLKYNAVSYTWADETGNDDLCKTIFVSEQPLSVTRNCENALKRIRKSDIEQTVWIDAVCINQNDTNERGHQVRLMTQIYSFAETVLIYIGEKSDDSDFHFDTITSSERQSNDQTSKLPQALRHLLSRPYFSRVWVLQEVALSKTATIICGDRRMLWKTLRETESKLNAWDKELMNTPVVKAKEGKLHATPGRLLDLLDISRRCKAKDPLDKVYALLGLVIDHKRQGLAVDYNVKVEDLYIQVAVRLASQHGWGEVICRAGTQNRSINALPSWVPDWSHSIENMGVISPITNYWEVLNDIILYNDGDDSLNIRVGYADTNGGCDILDNTQPNYSSTVNDSDASQYLFINSDPDLLNLLYDSSAGNTKNSLWHRSHSHDPKPIISSCTRVHLPESKIIGNRLTGTIQKKPSRVEYIVVHSLEAVRWLSQTNFLKMREFLKLLLLRTSDRKWNQFLKAIKYWDSTCLPDESLLQCVIKYEFGLSQPHNKLDSLWRDTFNLNKSQQAEFRKADRSYDLLVDFNDAIWKLLVRLSSRKVVQLKII